MFNKYRAIQFEAYKKARAHFIEHPEVLIELEHYFVDSLAASIISKKDELVRDYDEASYLYPFWQAYPPDERGRSPKGDQYPWIEVGEHAVGDKLIRILTGDFHLRDTGIPTGPDKRFVLENEKIGEITKGYTNSAWLFVDIKSVGPRDDQQHTVMSHNQISGSGVWDDPKVGVKNAVMTAHGRRISHPFHSSIPPIYVLSDGTVVPVVNVVLKTVYSMRSLNGKGGTGQPLQKITLVAIPNGLLLEEKPAYLRQYPGLFFPGKDDKGKNPLKVRARVDFNLLRKIDAWRVTDIRFD